MANSGSQLSAARSLSASGSLGLAFLSLSRLSVAHRRACRRRSANSAQSRRRQREFCAPLGLRCIDTMIARSSSVPARAPMQAIAFGAHVENRCDLCSPPISTFRMTQAAVFVCPLLRIPRASSLDLMNVSASSMTSAGC